jgi:protein required for attachment to host cells
MQKTYILIADAHRARCFERLAAGHALVELADFVSPHVRLDAQASVGDMSGAAGKGHGRTGHAGTQFEPHIAASDQDRVQFARLVAQYLNTAVMEHRCESLVLIATSPMLGDLKPLLSPVATKAIHHTVARDLSHFTGRDLAERVNHALETFH